MASGLLVGVSLQSDKYQCPIDTVVSPDDGHVVARNMYRREINILSRIVYLDGFIFKKPVCYIKYVFITMCCNTYTKYHYKLSI